MDVAFSVLICVFYIVEVNSVPADVCQQIFKWEDCGFAPKAVIYYYKSGSRCEVGLWRGCLPNPNMFVDEYECVQTCIFSLRARPEDFHDLAENEIEEKTNTAAVSEDTTVAAVTGDEEKTEYMESTSHGDNIGTSGEDNKASEGGGDNTPDPGAAGDNVASAETTPG